MTVGTVFALVLLVIMVAMVLVWAMYGPFKIRLTTLRDEVAFYKDLERREEIVHLFDRILLHVPVSCPDGCDQYALVANTVIAKFSELAPSGRVKKPRKSKPRK